MIGVLLSDKANLEHPLLGMHFAAYAQWCLFQKMAPQVRVFLLVKTVRSRVEHHRLKSISLQTLLQLPLPSHKLSDIKNFVQRVHLGLSDLRPDEIKDNDLMFTWLWDNSGPGVAFPIKWKRSRKPEKVLTVVRGRICGRSSTTI